MWAANNSQIRAGKRVAQVLADISFMIVVALAAPPFSFTGKGDIKQPLASQSIYSRFDGRSWEAARKNKYDSPALQSAWIAFANLPSWVPFVYCVKMTLKTVLKRKTFFAKMALKGSLLLVLPTDVLVLCGAMSKNKDCVRS